MLLFDGSFQMSRAKCELLVDAHYLLLQHAFFIGQLVAIGNVSFAQLGVNIYESSCNLLVCRHEQALLVLHHLRTHGDEQYE